MLDKAAQLASFYDAESASRATREIDPHRVERRTRFARLLAQEGRGTVLDLGSGRGRDATALSEAGLHVTCVDLAPANVGRCRAAGLDAHVASALDLPFPDAAFAAAWSMSVLMHLDDTELDRALRELRRVLAPGAPVAIGTWSSAATGPASTVDRPHFVARSDDDVHALLGVHGTVEQFETWHPSTEPDRTYQWTVLRTS